MVGITSMKILDVFIFRNRERKTKSHSNFPMIALVPLWKFEWDLFLDGNKFWMGFILSNILFLQN